MIEVSGVTKRYGNKVAVDNMSFKIRPGVVTGFLGPNGAGKSTVMRMIMGLDTPNAGSVTINGQDFTRSPVPMAQAGALLEARSFHPGRSAYHHLLALAQTNGISTSRVREVIEIVGLSSVARKRAGAFSLGMGQRLGIAGALLGDPTTLVLDEPVNGLDPQGVLWIRNLLRSLAAAGRTVFVSSHLMNEMALTAHHLIIIGRGKVIADVSVEEFIANSSRSTVRVRCTDPTRLRRFLLAQGATVADESPVGRDEMLVAGLSSDQIGRIAGHHSITVLEVSPQQASLEAAFMELTQNTVEYHGHVDRSQS